MRWALVGPLHPYRGGIAHYGALAASALAGEDEVRALNFTLLYPDMLFPGRTQMDASERALTFPSTRQLSSVDPLSWERSARLVESWRPDAVLFQWWHPFFGPAYGWMARRLARRLPSARRLYLCHNVEPHEASRLDRALRGYGLKPAQGLLAHGDQDAAALRRLLPGRAVEVHPHPPYGAFGEGEEREAARAALGVGEDERMLLFFGLVREYKGLDLALEALALGEDPRLRLWVVGEFYENRALTERRIEKLGLDGRVTLVDRYVPNEEVSRYFRAADLAVLPYRSATQSGIVQIAQAEGLPVLATAVGGLPEQIEDGVTGLLAPPENAGALARAITRYFAEELSGPFRRALAERKGGPDWRSLAAALRRLAAEAAP